MIRAVRVEDAEAIARIYNYYVEQTVISFELEPISVEQMRERMELILSKGFPYWVFEQEGCVMGYCYLNTWNVRCAYEQTAELSIYLSPESRRAGLGTQLFAHLMNHLDSERVHTIVSGITLPNEASVALHEKFGFRQVSFFRQVGWKMGQWQDVGHWQWIKTEE